jgi:hypothetical protein
VGIIARIPLVRAEKHLRPLNDAVAIAVWPGLNGNFSVEFFGAEVEVIVLFTEVLKFDHGRS